MTKIALRKCLELVDRLIGVRDMESLSRCVTGELRAVLGFDCVIGGLARVRDGAVYPELLVQSQFPAEYLDEISGADASVSSPILTHWLKRPAPLAIDFRRCGRPLDADAMLQIRRYELDNVLAHGHYSPTTGLLTYFSFHRVSAPLDDNLKQWIARLMPHLHCALMQMRPPPLQATVAPTVPAPPWQGLSDRQQQIVRWLIQGKSNWEIARIAGTSEANVKYHLASLMRKFSVSNRSALVFKVCQAPEPQALLRSA